MKYVLTAAALLRLATVVTASEDPIVLGEGSEDVSGEEWASVSENANLTYTQSFTGRDVTASYPGESQDGWSIHLAVKDNLPGADDQELTASTISIIGPDGGDVEFDDSWNLCLHVFSIKSSSAPDGFGTEYEPTCEGIVAPECVDDLKKNGISKFENGCPVFKSTPSCLRDLTEDVSANSVAINSGNAGRLVGNDTSFWRQADGTHEPDEEEPTVLITAAGNAQAVLSVWGPSGDSDEEPFANVVCVLPDTVVGDSFDPAAPEEGAASGIAAFASWALLSTVVAFQLL